MQTITLRLPDAEVAVTIRLGPKVGILVGTVRDAVTGDALNPCVRLTRVSDPNLFLEGTGLVNHVYRLLIPSNTDVMMEVWLEGYKTWHYTRSKHRSTIKSVRLEPGEEQRLDIQLEPDSKANQGSLRYACRHRCPEVRRDPCGDAVRSAFEVPEMPLR